MPFQELRRSERLGTYDANGRDYLSSKVGWSRPKFEEWLYSETVRPHLQSWYTTCITNKDRYNDGIDWINTGERGYFYNESDLEEHLLLMCLDVGKGGKDVKGGEGCGNTDFVDEEIDTTDWITQQLWARIAWRVVHGNCAEGQVFYDSVKNRPATAYGFVIETLCIIFHSVAFRGNGSVYLPLLKGGTKVNEVKSYARAHQGGQATPDSFHDDTSEAYTASSTSEAVDHSSDATFTDTKKERAASELSTIILPPNGQAPTYAEDDDCSNILVAPRKLSNSTATASTPKMADDSSKKGSNEQDPLTPDTSGSMKETAIFNGEVFSKSERVREWIERTE